jgi:hypothetical protein
MNHPNRLESQSHADGGQLQFFVYGEALEFPLDTINS